MDLPEGDEPTAWWPNGALRWGVSFRCHTSPLPNQHPKRPKVGVQGGVADELNVGAVSSLAGVWIWSRPRTDEQCGPKSTGILLMVMSRDPRQSGMGTRLLLGSWGPRVEGGLGDTGTPIGERLMGLSGLKAAVGRT